MLTMHHDMVCTGGGSGTFMLETSPTTQISLVCRIKSLGSLLRSKRGRFFLSYTNDIMCWV